MRLLPAFLAAKSNRCVLPTGTAPCIPPPGEHNSSTSYGCRKENRTIYGLPNKVSSLEKFKEFWVWMFLQSYIGPVWTNLSMCAPYLWKLEITVVDTTTIVIPASFQVQCWAVALLLSERRRLFAWHRCHSESTASSQWMQSVLFGY